MGTERDNQLRELQTAELSLFKIFTKVCEEHSIRYYALGGTLLGAIRHQGFIPWDDDIDVGIPRPDYDRFCQIMKRTKLNKNIIFRTWKTDKNYNKYFAHLEDCNISIMRNDRMIPERLHAWIDIFPLDAMPNNFILRQLKVFEVLVLYTIFKFSCFDTTFNMYKKNRPFYERILIQVAIHTPVTKLFNTKKSLARMERSLTKTPYGKSNFLVNATGAYKFKEMFNKKHYGDGRMYKFEDTEICGPDDYNFVCKQLYGDYMSYPPENKRNHHMTTDIKKVEG